MQHRTADSPVLWIVIIDNGHIELYEKRGCHTVHSLLAPHFTAGEASSYLEDACRQGKFNKFALVASMADIAALRQHFSYSLQALVMADIERIFNDETQESLIHKLEEQQGTYEASK